MILNIDNIQQTTPYINEVNCVQHQTSCISHCNFIECHFSPLKINYSDTEIGKCFESYA